MPLSQTEAVARALLQHYLPHWRPQYNVRPDWLKYPPTGRNLELDIYFPDQKVAVEVSGVQHGRHIKGLQPTFQDFIVQQRRDAFKAEACQRLGITLYSLTSFQFLQRNFEPFIRQFLTESEWRRTTPPLHLYRQAEKLSRMRVVRHSRRTRSPIPLLQRMWRRLGR